MRILLTTLNAKYVHSSLALRYLKNYCQDEFSQIILKEYTINDSLDYITAELFQEKADIIAFSCYIWNITQTLMIVENIKKVAPETIIILGGAEVSYDPEEILKANPAIAYIVVGEGEIAFKKLLGYLVNNQNDLLEISGVAFLWQGQIKFNTNDGIIKDLDSIPSPYGHEEDLIGLKNKIIYYESSRGCPFNCQYCLSSTNQGVRFFSLNRVKEDLLKLIKEGVKQVKFVDRTFNCNKKHTMELMKFLMDEGEGVNFHFEIAADLLDEDMLELLKNVPAGRFQFEIGIQSTNPKTIKDIQRKMNLDKVFANVSYLRFWNNIHLHLDLIAGLPYEDLVSFRDSFDEVYQLQPHQLQLGFLKMLKGSGVRSKAEEYNYLYQSHPPYQVLSNQWINYSELIKLHQIEELVERYNNSGAFYHSLKFIINNIWESPFDFFNDLADYWLENDLYKISHSQQGLYDILAGYYSQRNFPQQEAFKELLKFDLLSRNRVLNLPKWSSQDRDGLKEYIWELLKDQEKVSAILPNFKEQKAKDIIKKIHYASFTIDIKGLITSHYKQISNGEFVIIFDYNNRNIIDNNADFYIVNN